MNNALEGGYSDHLSWDEEMVLLKGRGFMEEFDWPNYETWIAFDWAMCEDFFDELYETDDRPILDIVREFEDFISSTMPMDLINNRLDRVDWVGIIFYTLGLYDD